MVVVDVVVGLGIAVVGASVEETVPSTVEASGSAVVATVGPDAIAVVVATDDALVADDVAEQSTEHKKKNQQDRIQNETTRKMLKSTAANRYKLSSPCVVMLPMTRNILAKKVIRIRLSRFFPSQVASGLLCAQRQPKPQDSNACTYRRSSSP